MLHSVTTDRRQHRRYLVTGKAVLNTPSGEIAGELVDVGPGGLLLLSNATPPLGEPVEVRFTMEDYPLEVRAEGRVVHTDVAVVGIAFQEESESLEEVLLWLEAGFIAQLL